MVEFKSEADGEYRFGADEGQSTLKLRTEKYEAQARQLKAAEMEAKKKTEGGSR